MNLSQAEILVEPKSILQEQFEELERGLAKVDHAPEDST
jgi:hypothetical protein